MISYTHVFVILLVLFNTCNQIVSLPYLQGEVNTDTTTIGTVATNAATKTTTDTNIGATVTTTTISGVRSTPITPESSSQPPPPIVIIPGTGGSQLEAKIDKPTTVHYYCAKKSSDYFPLWLSLPSLLPGSVDCWADNIRLVYDEDTDQFINSSGVETRTLGFGDTSGFDSLDRQGIATYFKPLTDYLVNKEGMIRGETLRGAPYDFRHAPTDEWLSDIKELVEDTYTAQNKKVALVSHSMGCLYTLRFLNLMPEDWKEKYILLWVPIAPVFGGSTNIIQLMASGNNEGVKTVKPIWLREEQRSYESNLWMIPSYKLWKNEGIIFTDKRSYTMLQLKDFFSDIGYAEGFKYYERTKDLTSEMLHPGVDVHVFYSTGIDTPSTFTWKDGNFDNQPSSIEMGDGDGTVPLRSLLFGQSSWGNNKKEGKTIQHTEFKQVTHSGIVKHTELMEKLTTVIKDAVIEQKDKNSINSIQNILYSTSASIK